MDRNLRTAIRLLKRGGFVLLHDSRERENEVDLVFLADRATPRHVLKMRTDGGGLLCVALHPRIAKNFGLPYLSEVYETAAGKFRVLRRVRADDLPYDERSAFSLSVNHRKTYTGITDADRALTIRRLGEMGREAMHRSMISEFGEEFRSPGHVPLLCAAQGLLDSRKGHTELAVAVAELAGETPVVAVCEMLDGRTHRALSVEKAREYARRTKSVLLNGALIEKAWRESR
jgi:3,4-dihydroxy 2-butanone 4-phosphate synthase